MTTAYTALAWRRAVKITWWGGYLSGARCDADCLYVVQLMSLHTKTPLSLASFKSALFLPFMAPAYPGCSGKEAVKRVL